MLRPMMFGSRPALMYSLSARKNKVKKTGNGKGHGSGKGQGSGKGGAGAGKGQGTRQISAGQAAWKKRAKKGEGKK